MGRKIILLSDGTGNSSAKVWRTNVWRTFEALDLSGNDQVALYDDGVGTSSFKPMAILGGAFGFGLRRNVIALYKFACRNYRDPDDELFGFGFSRGAFTIRIVMGLIDSQGLIQASNETELDSLASAAYRAYRRDRYPNLKLEAPYQWIRNKFGPAYPPPGVRRNIKIRFVGVWDTVAAYGMPVDEMTRGIHQYLWPIELPNNRLAGNVMRACQALALDEERTTFHPQLWNEPGGPKADDNPPPPAGPRFIKDERLSQVWFSGVHSNVGGGYPDDSLAYIPFVWMITEARRCGLKFKSDYANDPVNPDVMRADPDTFKNAVSKRDKDGRLYDPRRGLGGYYRYGPRKLVPDLYPQSKKQEDDEVSVGRAKIHESVFRRIDNHAQAYAPVGLPPTYDVVKENGEIVTPDNYHFESNARAADRAEAQEYVWNEIWKRRIVYFVTVGATIWLVIFPLVSSAQRADEYYTRLRWISDLVRFIGRFLPNIALTWIEGYARSPFWFSVITILLVVLLGWAARIAARTANLMGAIWRRTPAAPSGLPHNWIYRLRSSGVYIAFHEGLKRKVAPFLFAVMFVYFGFAVFSHISFDILDVAGQTCLDHAKDPNIPRPLPLAMGETKTVSFKISDLCTATGIMLATNGAHYLVVVEPSGPWDNGHFQIPVGGFSAKDPPTWYQRLFLTLYLPLRRELLQDWFRIGLRYGRVGGEEDFFEPDPTDPVIQNNIHPTRDGELFIFVNDAVLGIPGLYGWPYRNNGGSAQLTVKRTR
jgi:uncharacterized protein (DUF2235 family)